jgi:hypothetical protein
MASVVAGHRIGWRARAAWKEIVGRVGEGLTDEHGEDNGSGVAEQQAAWPWRAPTMLSPPEPQNVAHLNSSPRSLLASHQAPVFTVARSHLPER